MEKEKWIEGVINSTKGKALAEVDGNFTAKLFARIEKPQNAAPVVSMKWLSAAACAACLLLVCNISLLHKWNSIKQQSVNSSIVAAGNDYLPDGLDEDYNFFN